MISSGIFNKILQQLTRFRSVVLARVAWVAITESSPLMPSPTSELAWSRRSTPSARSSQSKSSAWLFHKHFVKPQITQIVPDIHHTPRERSTTWSSWWRSARASRSHTCRTVFFSALESRQPSSSSSFCQKYWNPRNLQFPNSLKHSNCKFTENWLERVVVFSCCLLGWWKVWVDETCDDDDEPCFSYSR